MTVPLAILDLADVGPTETIAGRLRSSVELAQHAEGWGYRRVWYAEHHNMSTIASAATSVLIAHIAAHTRSIRLGAGGVMLPNHSPLVIAEQFGTLASLHPGRIDLGLGRAPGTDQRTFRALRRDPRAADRFPDDVLELQAYLRGDSLVPGVDATPGKGTDVPLYILGSSLFGAQLAAALGLPYAFASHFAPQALEPAVAAYREGFQPSPQLADPYVMAGINVIASDSVADAQDQLLTARRRRAKLLFGRRDRRLTTDEVDLLLDSPAGQQVDEMMRYTAAGTAQDVSGALDRFAEHIGADELILASSATDQTRRLRTFELIAETRGLTAAA
ncbi:LLM class flavin-dependent oxidoreductase [Nitriliruptor alkaliphilus]|uniref:LLM class flavin-dependent oxidoreductase n=1 Tax=Nitriliruptor alkaliphilus TaxID=427918 RepID=UPI000697821B|nr:LLM class flavin-dependent oxidoreductase [Nitriliruptor alkaliphilus]